MAKLKILIAMMMLLLVFNTNAQAGDYKLVKKDGLISLYEKWIKVMNGEQAREIKAVFFVKATPTEAIQLLKDQSKGKDWNPNADAYKVVASANTNSWVSYLRYDIPWPVGDQDCCLAYTMKESATATEILFESTNHASFPSKSGVGRINGTKGKWLLEKNANGMMKITYTISTNKNTKLPRFITDPIIHDNLMESLTLFTEILENKGL
jgi:hypothetical protein